MEAWRWEAAERSHIKDKPVERAELSWWAPAAGAALCGAALLLALSLHNALPPPAEPRAGAPPPHAFSAERAQRLLRNLTALGPRVAGSRENDALGVAWALAALHAAGEGSAHELRVEVSRESGGFPLAFLDGMNSAYRGVRSVVARLSPRERPAGGGRRRALLLNCHIDTVPGSPGASDDGAGCAVLAEAARALAARPQPLPHDVVFLFNGAEENIMQGSHAFVTRHRWAGDVRAFVNLEACGAGGREVLFQAGPAPWVLQAYAAAVARPFASSLAQQLFESGLVPGDTDFRIFRDFGGLSGLDLAWSANGYVYHTALDVAEAVPLGSLRRAGEHVVALALELLSRPEMAAEGRAREGEGGVPIYFDVGGAWLVMLSSPWPALALALLLQGTRFALHARATRLWRRESYGRVAAAWAARATAALACGVLWSAATGAALQLLGAAMSWYSRPALLLPLYALPALAAAALALLWLAPCPPRPRPRPPRRCPRAECAAGVALAWLLAAVAAATAVPRLAFVPLLWALPDAAVALAREALAQRAPRAPAWAWAAAAAAAGCAQSAYQSVGVLSALVPVLGRAGSATPVEPALAALTALLTLLTAHWLLPLLLITRRPRPLVYGALALGLGTALAVAGSETLRFPYSAAAPQRHLLLHTRTTAHPPHPVSGPGLGYWLPELDLHSHRTLDLFLPPSAVAGGGRSDGGSCAHVMCGAPYPLPALSLVPRARWLPAAEEPLLRIAASARLHRTDAADSRRLEVEVSGAAHVVLVAAPVEGARVRDMGVGRDHWRPQEGAPWGRRRTYFTLLHHAHGERSDFRLSMLIQKDADRKGKEGEEEHWVDLSVAGHCNFGACRVGHHTARLLRLFPDWTAVTASSADLHLFRL